MAIDLLNLINRQGVAAGYDPSFAGLEEEQKAATAASSLQTLESGGSEPSETRSDWGGTVGQFAGPAIDAVSAARGALGLLGATTPVGALIGAFSLARGISNLMEDTNKKGAMIDKALGITTDEELSPEDMAALTDALFGADLMGTDMTGFDGVAAGGWAADTAAPAFGDLGNFGSYANPALGDYAAFSIALDASFGAGVDIGAGVDPSSVEGNAAAEAAAEAAGAYGGSATSTDTDTDTDTDTGSDTDSGSDTE